MIRSFVTTVIPVILILGSALFVRAHADTTSGMQFLEIGPSTESLAISQAHTAVYNGASSIYSNPSLLTRSEQTVGTASYTLWLGNTSHSHAAVNIPRENDAFAFGLLSNMVGDIEQRDTPGEPSGTFDINYISVAGGYARDVGPLSLGVTGMYLNEMLFNQSASGYAFTFGASTTFYNDRITAAAALLNLGQMQDLDIQATPLPTSIKTGIQADLIQFSVSETDEVPILISLSTDIVQPVEEIETDEDRRDLETIDEWYVAAGLSVEIAEIITLHGGYRSGNTIRPYSMGGSLSSGNLKFDYSFVPFETGFQRVHSVGLSYQF